MHKHTTIAFVLAGLIAGFGGTRAAFGQTSGASADRTRGIVPFTIHVPDDDAAGPKRASARTRFPQEIPGTGWDYGTDLTT